MRDVEADDVDGYSLLIWWAEAVALLSSLPRHRAAQALSRLAEEVRETVAMMLDREVVAGWEVNRWYGFEVVPVGERVWKVGDVECRMVG